MASGSYCVWFLLLATIPCLILMVYVINYNDPFSSSIFESELSVAPASKTYVVALRNHSHHSTPVTMMAATPIVSTASPTASPSANPTASPSAKPTTSPSAEPTASPTGSPSARPTASLNQIDLETEFVFVSYASNGYFDRLENFVGSVHYWMPSMKVVIYDLGMTKQQISEIYSWENIKAVEHFEFDDYPPFVKTNLKFFAWQPLVLSIAARKYRNILMQDSGQELRQRIGVLHLLSKIYFDDGVFFTQLPNATELKLTHIGTQKYLNITMRNGQCQGGIVGISLDGPAAATTAATASNTNNSDSISKYKKHQIEQFLTEYTACAIQKKCIAPDGSSLRNHRYSQSVQSLLIEKNGWKEGSGITRDIAYYEWRQSKLTKNETFTNNISLFSRRGGMPKPYAKYILKK